MSSISRDARCGRGGSISGQTVCSGNEPIGFRPATLESTVPLPGRVAKLPTSSISSNASHPQARGLPPRTEVVRSLLRRFQICVTRCGYTARPAIRGRSPASLDVLWPESGSLAGVHVCIVSHSAVSEVRLVHRHPAVQSSGQVEQDSSHMTRTTGRPVDKERRTAVGGRCGLYCPHWLDGTRGAVRGGEAAGTASSPSPTSSPGGSAIPRGGDDLDAQLRMMSCMRERDPRERSLFCEPDAVETAMWSSCLLGEGALCCGRGGRRRRLTGLFVQGTMTEGRRNVRTFTLVDALDPDPPSWGRSRRVGGV